MKLAVLTALTTLTLALAAPAAEADADGATTHFSERDTIRVRCGGRSECGPYTKAGCASLCRQRGQIPAGVRDPGCGGLWACCCGVRVGVSVREAEADAEPKGTE